VLRRSMLVATLGLVTLVASGCKPATHPTVKELTVAESIAAHKAGVVFLDANGEDFRKDNGKVPGAVLLANYRTYDVKSVLPENKDAPLVFYCSSKL
jgi:hypothetical protein